ncbi:hypothetical protein BLX24_18915 [Arsenicibacter rosenii]|uniref:Uncharacterized protein n=1 Tax=Arsenicibacter rosenii TaxID=1750698 RepID=A0A1S2VGM0_9BACT|nr:hypothetical protein BLX24_18915 [Arsenicibacter rosenii]
MAFVGTLSLHKPADIRKALFFFICANVVGNVAKKSLNKHVQLFGYISAVFTLYTQEGFM